MVASLPDVQASSDPMSKLIFAVEGAKMILPMSEQLGKSAQGSSSKWRFFALQWRFFALHRIGPSANHKG
jgi:hypothetical protein